MTIVKLAISMPSIIIIPIVRNMTALTPTDLIPTVINHMVINHTVIMTCSIKTTTIIQITIMTTLSKIITTLTLHKNPTTIIGIPLIISSTKNPTKITATLAPMATRTTTTMMVIQTRTDRQQPRHLPPKHQKPYHLHSRFHLNSKQQNPAALSSLYSTLVQRHLGSINIHCHQPSSLRSPPPSPV